MQCNWKGRV
uniref:Uncharacterized protein n=1 Tax=Arundo donax TaxID=35708 RepID=A0A0A9QQ41_ARUDO